jgi:hypothetical protein
MIGTDGKLITPSDLTLKITTEDIVPGKLSIKLKVPYPTNYPLTIFRKNNDANMLAKLEAYVQDDSIKIELFYVYSSKYFLTGNRLATEDESRLTKDLGKRMLCHILNYALEKNYIRETSTIHLEADGVCSNKKTQEAIKTWSYIQLRDFIKRTPALKNALTKSRGGFDMFDIYFNIVENHRETTLLICEYYLSERLVNYYKSYGLVPDGEISSPSVLMKGIVKDALVKCKTSSPSIPTPSHSMSQAEITLDGKKKSRKKRKSVKKTRRRLKSIAKKKKIHLKAKSLNKK